MDGDMMGMLRQVMDDPQFGEMMRTMKAQMGEGGADPSRIMEKLPEMMAMLGPVMHKAGQNENNGGETGSPPAPAQPSAETGEGPEPSAQPVGAGTMLFRPGSREKRNRLLAALKPYLSPTRCALVDRAMSAMQLGELLGIMAPSGQKQ